MKEKFIEIPKIVAPVYPRFDFKQNFSLFQPEVQNFIKKLRWRSCMIQDTQIEQD